MHSERFLALDSYLTELQIYWKFAAFHQDDYPWIASNEQLANWLDSLSPQQVQDYLSDSSLAYPILQQHVQTLLSTADQLFNIPALKKSEEDYPFWLKTGIKGRKWQQISEFAEQIESTQPILEWCAGKGHLGRLISWKHSAPVISVEWQQTLCELGKKQADKLSIKQKFVQADVLQGQADNCVCQEQHAIALHACGDLHLRLIALAKQNRTQQLSISPCCYHLIQSEYYQPISSIF